MMREGFKNFVLIVRNFRREDGVAAVEFALILPFLLALYFGSMEASALFAADRRVNTISSTMGDLVSQWDDDDGPIPVATMNDYFAAAQSELYPMASTGLKQVVTCVQVLADGVTTKVIWSKGYNGGVAKAVNTSYTITARMRDVAKGGYVIASQTFYSYKPLLGQMFPTALNLYHENLYLPRYGALISVS